VGTNLSYPTENYARRKLLIVTADDMGLTLRVNEAIEKAHREGIVTTASLMVNSAAFEPAADILHRNPGLDVGLHLNLTEGRPASVYGEIPSIADAQGFLYRHPFELLSALVRRRVGIVDLEKEIRAQIEKALSVSIHVTHIDGHKHVHVLPQVFHLICKVAPQYGINAVRSISEKTPGLFALIWRNGSRQIMKQYLFGKALSAGFALASSTNNGSALTTPARFYGITQTGFLDIRSFAAIVEGLGYGVNEVMCHPGYVDDDLRRTPTRLHAQRERELELLTGREVHEVLQRAGVTLVSYRDLRDSGNYN
jgi:hopanoid biosynthesis associated protein HpnK